MVTEYDWNGYKGKIEKLFIRNLGVQNLQIEQLYITNDNDILNGAFGNAITQVDFNHAIYPWKMLPTSVVYTDDVTLSPLKTTEIQNGSLTWDVEVFPPVTSTNYVSPFHRPTFISEGDIYGTFHQAYSLPTGPGLTRPFLLLSPNQQSLLYGHKLRDYYRLPHRINLPPYINNNNHIEFILGCFPLNKADVYKGAININYQYTNTTTGVVVLKTMKVDLEMDLTSTNFTEVNKIDKDDVFSIDGTQINSVPQLFIDLF